MRSLHTARAACALLALSGAAFAQTANEDQKFFSSNFAQDDFFGFDLEVDGDRAIVGAPLHDGISLDTGSAYVYERQPNGQWLEVWEFFFTLPDQGDLFGAAVSLDGDRAAIAARLDDDGGTDAGAVYIFERQFNSTWIEVAKLVASDAADGDQFGRSVSLDGDRVAVGAWGNDDNGSASGSAYIFDRQINGTWTETQKLLATDAGAGDQFGSAIDLDGNRVVVGANLDDHSATADAGAAYVFDFVPAQNLWRPRAKLVANPPGTGDGFGLTVDVDGDRIAIGNLGQDQGPTFQTGSVHVFERQPNGTWPQVVELTASDAAAGWQFGSSVVLEGDRMLVGSNGQNTQTGAAYLFERQPNNTWLEVVKLTASDGATEDFYGDIVGLSGDNIIVSATVADDPISTQTNVGAMYAYTWGTLFHGPATISVSAGGTHDLLLRAGPAFAGQVYVILGNANTGNVPGLTDPGSGVTVPLNFDAYTLFLLQTAGGGVINPWFGILDADGKANSGFVVPMGTPSAFAGSPFDHAFLTVDVFGTGLATSASNPVDVLLVN